MATAAFPPATAVTRLGAMTIRKTDPIERVDMMLVQAERFAALSLTGEAVARAKEAMAHCEREVARHPELAETLRMRELIAEALIQRLGRSVRDMRGHLRVDGDDASNPDAWA